MHGSCLLTSAKKDKHVALFPHCGRLSHVLVGILWGLESKRKKVGLRAGEGHQSSGDNNEVQNIPQVPKIRARVEEQSQVNHLQAQSRQEHINGIIKTSKTIFQAKADVVLPFLGSLS